jgi:outer membrane protein assembly factor BamD
MRVSLVAFAACALLTPACASVGTFMSGEGEVQYAADAEENLRKGNEALESKNYPEAQSFFEHVRTKYPYLEAAKTAELKLADLDFDRDRFVEARDRYNTFVRIYPTHPKAEYAAFRAALTHYKDIPSDFFLLPPASEKDQVEVRNALASMKEFLRAHPESEFTGEANKVITEVKLRLAEHELYVADFYAKRERWPAVVNRLKVVAKNYAGIGLDERVAFGLHDAYLKLNDTLKAREALTDYIAKFPEAPAAKRAQRLLEKLPAPSPDAGS